MIKEIDVSEKIGISDERWNELAELMTNIVEKHTCDERINVSGVLGDVLKHVENLDRKEIFVLGYMFGTFIGYHEGLFEGMAKALISSMAAFKDVIKNVANILTKKDIENLIKKKRGDVGSFDTSENN